MHYLKLIRYKNLIIIALTQWLFKWMLIDVFFKDTALTDIHFSFLVFSTVLIAAAGNIINDIQDITTDRINKHKEVIVGVKITEKRAYQLYLFTNITGVALGLYVANSSGKSGFTILFVIIALLLYYYSTSLKKILLAGNLVVSLLVALTVIIIGIFTLLPIASDTNQYIINYVFRILFYYAVFAFYINFLREIIKDVQDVNGDHAANVKSLPIVLGKRRTLKILSVLSVMPCAALLAAVYEYLHTHPLLNAYILFAIMGPLLFISFTAWDAKKAKQYSTISTLLKIVMVLGVLSIIIVRYTLFKQL